MMGSTIFHSPFIEFLVSVCNIIDIDNIVYSANFIHLKNVEASLEKAWKELLNFTEN